MINRLSKFVLISYIVALICLVIKGCLYKKEIEENRAQTICKYSLCETSAKFTTSFFKYNVKEHRYRNSYGRCPENYDDKINKFFILYYSSRDPNKIEVHFNQQITDTLEILKADFSMDEIKN